MEVYTIVKVYAIRCVSTQAIKCIYATGRDRLFKRNARSIDKMLVKQIITDIGLFTAAKKLTH